ncbi:MAG: homocysteine S-methyltransferase [Firmicutes bacterium]|nr:homocysteine S-methyltransferase [Bacillota bacterium]
MKADLGDILNKEKIMVIDGSMSTPLERMGADLNDELWTAGILRDQPELIKKVHLDYFRAGADCGITASYQATIPGLIKKGLTEAEAEDIIASSVRIFREARDEWWEAEGGASGREYPLCLGSVGPYGAYLADGSEYRGNYSISDDELRVFHRRRMELLKDAGADMLLIETIPSRREAMIAQDLAEELDIDYWISFSCMSGKSICEGDLIRDCVTELVKDHPHLRMIGVNCTDPRFIVSLIGEIKAGLTEAERDIPIGVYPNSGEKYDPRTKTWTKAGEGLAFGAYAYEYMKAGADAVGGCCTTVASHIRQVAEARDRFLRERSE